MRRPTCRSRRSRSTPGDVRAQVDDGTLDAAVIGGKIVAKDEPDDELVSVLQAANRQVSAAEALEQAGVAEGRAERILDPQPLKLATLEPIDPDEDAKAGLTFFIVLILYGQLLTYGYWVAAGVVEEKASRVVEVVLSTIRPSHLLAGKVIGLGLLGLGNLLLIGVIGLGTAAATGALDVDGTVLSAAGLSLAWFVVGYAFYACAFACAGRARLAPGGPPEHDDAAHADHPRLVLPGVRRPVDPPTVRSPT